MTATSLKSNAESVSSDNDPQLQALARQVEAQLNLIQRQMRQTLQSEFARGNLTGPQRLVMQTLLESSTGLSLKELSRSVSLAHSTVSGIADRLEKQGLVSRQSDEQDRRITRLVPSKAVREFLTTRMPQLAIHPLVQALASSSGPERKAIAKGLDTLARLLGESPRH